MDSGEAISLPRPKERPARGSVKRGGHHYLLVEERVSWHVARARCAELGGQLACAETPEELDILRELVADGPWCWVGATDAAQEGKWTWLSGAEVGEIWPPKQPDNWDRLEHAAALGNGGELHDRHAGTRSAFLCEWGAAPIPPWTFESRTARRAKEGYDEAVLAAREERDIARGKLEDRLERPGAACSKRLVKAEKALARDLEEAMKAEVREKRTDVALTIRVAKEAVERGDYAPVLPWLSSGVPPPDATSVEAGRHFKLFRDPLPWHEARDRCARMGGRLAVAWDVEGRSIAQELAGRHACWLGATDLEQEGDWRWLDGREVRSGWLEGEPCNLRGWEHCMHGTGSGWNDQTGEIRQLWICEWVQ